MVETQQEGVSLLKMFFICVALREINMFSFEVLFVILKYSSNKSKIFQLNKEIAFYKKWPVELEMWKWMLIIESFQMKKTHIKAHNLVC